ncbi:flavin reductase family protein [Paremcibacter congregatus]|uniref:Flavin reductase like domain-containing protein n=1 Tax=Paremcibacter congregatus TaxID=2043170 RepID=A0A2G4YTR3_9PROT|nr:flavin reductase family protein [Paremcibacter congregatus]PHZ85715.1 hypothetical protein CRD36_03255 [Paremcibacter congregatus]QDE26678.1 flavin reductase family protein [Paremcibacter congregatus]
MTETVTALQENFRQTMRRMAATVSIITTATEDTRLGMTATSVTCVSFEPLSMLVCVHKGSKFHDLMEKSDTFCINLLHQSQENISNHFSRPGSGEDQFTLGQWSMKNGLPFLEEAQANIFITVKKVTGFGSHSLFIGEVTDLQYNSDVAPLLYANGNYAGLKAAS